jgi:hypothetical protein
MKTRNKLSTLEVRPFQATSLPTTCCFSLFNTTLMTILGFNALASLGRLLCGTALKTIAAKPNLRPTSSRGTDPICL